MFLLGQRSGGIVETLLLTNAIQDAATCGGARSNTILKGPSVSSATCYTSCVRVASVAQGVSLKVHLQFGSCAPAGRERCVDPLKMIWLSTVPPVARAHKVAITRVSFC
eukprot:49758-Amphidinium_carterae.1